MSDRVLADVFTADEVARAAGVPLADVRAALEADEIVPIRGTALIAGADAVRIGRRLRRAGPSRPARRGLLGAACASSAVHAVLVAAAVWLSAGAAPTASVEALPATPAHLVFILSPGPGGGGGGGGLRNPRPAARLQRPAPDNPRDSAPPVVEAVSPPPAPIARTREPAFGLNAPIVPVAADLRDQAGVMDRADERAMSQGPGANGGAGPGQGAGSGAAAGSGIGDGLGGGTGGGPYRPGAGIEPPRLLREVKAVYTDEARQRGVTGSVLLEVVVRRDGLVGGVSILRGLGAGLEERAIEAVRQWRFAPARRHGVAVDVVVEVAVEFTQR